MTVEAKVDAWDGGAPDDEDDAEVIELRGEAPYFGAVVYTYVEATRKRYSVDQYWG